MKPRQIGSAALLALMLALLAGGVRPAAAGTVNGEAALSVGAVAAAARTSVVGILTTLKANRTTSRNRAAGTGWVYRDGVIMTNAHVVENAAEVKILYPDRSVETVTPEKIFADRMSDIAVIKVARAGLKPLPQGDSDRVAVGQPVVAVGNPLGFRLGHTVTAGILSGTGRALGSGYPFLQMDAPINPGNSGGPLFNLQGEVIGINSAKMAETGVEGLGFAIPINTARQIADTLIRDGKVDRPTLGIDLDEGWEAQFGIPSTEGVTIANIILDGPAGPTALRQGDKLVKLDDTPIATADDVSSFLVGKRPGDTVTVTVKRGGQLLGVRVRLASKEALRAAFEEEGTEVTGLLMDLSAGQVQEAAEFGRALAKGEGQLNRDYVAVSGQNYAILWSEYLYVARRIASAYEFGFQPGVAFQQAVAREIRNKLEVQMEIHGNTADFLKGAAFTLEQGSTQQAGELVSSTYTAAADGSVVIGNAFVRFSSAGLNPTEEIVVKVRTADQKVSTFRFTIKDLR